MICALQLAFSLRTKGKTITGHDNLNLTANKNADLLLFGSSRCWAHFDPAFFDSAYSLKSINIGVEGHSDIVFIKLRLKNYLSKNTAPKFAILSFDPFFYAGDSSDNQNFVKKDIFARYAFLPDKSEVPIVDYFKFTYLERYMPLYAVLKYRIFFSGILLNKRVAYLKTGNGIRGMVWDTLAKPVNLNRRKEFIKSNSVDSVQIALGGLNQLCRDNGIKLICVQTPIYKAFQADSGFQYTRIICERLKIPFIDVNDPEIEADYRNFVDAFHLNRAGVNKMNAILAGDSTLKSFLKH